jgi:hypothetical protein
MTRNDQEILVALKDRLIDLYVQQNEAKSAHNRVRYCEIQREIDDANRKRAKLSLGPRASGSKNAGEIHDDNSRTCPEATYTRKGNNRSSRPQAQASRWRRRA